MTPDLLVVGAGIAGSSVVRAARAASLSCLLLDADDARPSGSRAAVGLVRVAWMSAPQQKARTRRSLELYRAAGLLAADGAQVRHLTGRHPSRLDRDYAAVDIARALLEPDVRAVVGSVGDRTVVLADGRALDAARGVVVCAGAHSASLGGPALRVTWGATLDRGPEGGPPTPGLVIVHLRPYHCMALHGYTVGSVTARTPQEAIGRLRRDAALLGVPTALTDAVRVGVRAHSAVPTGQGFAPLWVRSTCYLAGFAKNGYALAPAVAEEVVARYRAEVRV